MLDMTALDRSGFVRTYGQPAFFPDDFYGDDEPTEDDFPPREHRQGVVSDHVRAASELPGVRIVRGEFAEYVIDDAAGGIAWPVLCSELIEVYTEDGVSDGRCGQVATDIDEGSCKGHGEERRGWRAMSEAERAHWERQHDEAHP